MIRKLMKLIKNYDTIMKMVESHNIDNKEMVNTKKNKCYSTFNTPENQLKYISKIKEGDK